MCVQINVLIAASLIVLQKFKLALYLYNAFTSLGSQCVNTGTILLELAQAMDTTYNLYYVCIRLE